MTSEEYNNQFTQEELNNEIWKDIPGWIGLYQVSNLGRVKSLNRWVFNRIYINKKGKIEGRILKPYGKTKRKHQYFWVMLSRNSKTTRVKIHRLVLTVFVGRTEEKLDACHNDNNSTNNRVENLRWDTRKGNFNDKISNNTLTRGEQHGEHKLTEKNVLKIRELYKEKNYTYVKLGRLFDVSDTCVRKIIRKQRWCWLKEENNGETE